MKKNVFICCVKEWYKGGEYAYEDNLEIGRDITSHEIMRDSEKILHCWVCSTKEEAKKMASEYNEYLENVGRLVDWRKV